MNHFAAYSIEVPGGFWAMCRFAQNGKPWPIMDGERPKVFTVRSAAIIAAQDHVIKHINGTMRRDGDRITALRATAEKLFMGGGKVIPVEQRRARA